MNKAAYLAQAHASSISDAAFRVLFFLVQAADENGQIRGISQKNIGQAISPATLENPRHRALSAIGELVDRGLIQRTRTRRSDGGNTSNLYQLLMERGQ